MPSTLTADPGEGIANPAAFAGSGAISFIFTISEGEPRGLAIAIKSMNFGTLGLAFPYSQTLESLR